MLIVLLLIFTHIKIYKILQIIIKKMQDNGLINIAQNLDGFKYNLFIIIIYYNYLSKNYL